MTDNRLNRQYYIDNEPTGFKGGTYFVLAYLIVMTLTLLWLFKINSNIK